MLVAFKADYVMDKDADGKASIKAQTANNLQIDAYELVTEIMRKDIAILEAVLAKLNYKPA